MKTFTSPNKVLFTDCNKNNSISLAIIPNNGVKAINQKAWLFLLLLMIFFAGIKLSAQIPMMRLKVSGPNNSLDETVLYYQDGATLSFDSEYDAYKLNGPNPGLMISQFYDSIRFLINAVNPVANSVTMPILITSPTSNNYTIYAEDFQEMPYGTCLKLIDRYSGVSTDLKTNNYVFYLSDTTTMPRFDLVISYMNLNFQSQLINASCHQPIANYLVKGTDQGPWNYIWKDTANNVLKTKLNSNEQDSFNLALRGTYKIYIESVGGCGYNNATFFIDTISTPTASFIIPDTLVLDSNNVFRPVNNSVNANSFLWNFGGDELSLYDTTSGYTYLNPGQYPITLVAFNNNGCTDTIINNIIVVEDTAQDNSIGLSDESRKNYLDITYRYLGENKILLTNPNEHVFKLSIDDMTGKNILSEEYKSNSVQVDLGNFTKGQYLVKIITNPQTQIFLLVLF